MPGTTVRVHELDGTSTRKMELPPVFATPIRPDMIKRAVVSAQSHRLQPQGRNPMAGKRTSAESLGVGHGLARVPRVKGSQYSRASAAAFAPSTVKGRATHPPRAEKRISKRLNKKEKRYAIRSAIAATGQRDLVERRGHADIPDVPLVVADEIEGVQSSAEARAIMVSLGAWADIERVRRSRKSMGGRRHSRGRGKRHAVGPLIVVSQDKGIGKAMRNFEGVDVVEVDRINAELLAPGTSPGRFTVWSESALRLLGIDARGT